MSAAINRLRDVLPPNGKLVLHHAIRRWGTARVVSALAFEAHYDIRVRLLRSLSKHVAPKELAFALGCTPAGVYRARRARLTRPSVKSDAIARAREEAKRRVAALRRSA